jgi:hypothetical protein
MRSSVLVLVLSESTIWPYSQILDLPEKLATKHHLIWLQLSDEEENKFYKIVIRASD